MSAARFDDLKRSLREIRDAANAVRDNGWSAAAELARVMHQHAARLGAVYELATVELRLKSTFSVACLEWDVLYKKAVASTSPSVLQETGPSVAARLALRIDTVLISMQVSRQP